MSAMLKIGEIEFKNVCPKETFDGVIEDDRVKEAMSILSNLTVGMRENFDKMSLDHLYVLRWALMDKFTELGVPSGLILPIMGSFEVVNRAIGVNEFMASAGKAPCRSVST
jgi:hypothetical protein